jgi:MoaA/NifB/PqqE/SkfB family radical SAM enzyme
MKATEYYLNLNDVCNERCVFCAADVHSAAGNSQGRRAVIVDEIRRWLTGRAPGRQDRVSLAGGEPTLHPELLTVVRLLAKKKPETVLFTNGLRLTDPAFARATAAAGVTCYQIAFFGASATAHDGITGVPGSFEKTIAALQTLAPLRPDMGIRVVVRLLVSRQSYAENPDIVSVIARRAPDVDGFSLNRLILSKSAEESDAPVSWKEARTSINVAARRVLQLGYTLQFRAIPFCLFDSDNADYVARELEARERRVARGEEPAHRSLRYFDPQHSGSERENYAARPVLADVCFRCSYVSSCSRVEPWYVRRFGTDGLITRP